MLDFLKFSDALGVGVPDKLADRGVTRQEGEYAETLDLGVVLSGLGMLEFGDFLATGSLTKPSPRKLDFL